MAAAVLLHDAVGAHELHCWRGPGADHQLELVGEEEAVGVGTDDHHRGVAHEPRLEDGAVLCSPGHDEALVELVPALCSVEVESFADPWVAQVAGGKLGTDRGSCGGVLLLYEEEEEEWSSEEEAGDEEWCN